MSEKKPTPTACLVDASPYVFRAYFSLPSSIETPDGAPANAVYGFASFLMKLLAEEAPSHLAVAFDESLTTSFRNDLYPDYKAQRELPPAELEAQLAACREVAEALGAATFADDTYEADDLVATLVERLPATARGVVVSGDKDLAQLVGERVTLYDFAKGDRLGAAEVMAKFGVEPAQVADLLALQGDAVDNIPGVPGIGAKTAAALFAHFSDLDDLYARLGEVAGLPIRGAKSLAGKLEEHRDTAFLCRRLATVVRDVSIDASFDDLAWHGADRAAIEALFDRLGFGRIRDRVPRWRE
ncbi:MAG TPA: 5'-3' exonuclease H3TH domain-containing protein [Thermoanaerobaculia bacterium]|nr:5'-3' exonuclease H3TH domain-containing protein [Thermoanaerobaculia bacterium]